MAKANLSAVAKVLAAQFSQLTSLTAQVPLHRTLNSAARSAAEAQQEKEIRNLRDLIGLISLPDPDITRKITAALDGLLLLRTMPVSNGALYFDACSRVAEAVRSAARHTLNARVVRAAENGSILREATRCSAAAIQLASFAEIVGSAYALNFSLEPEASLTHVIAALLHALSVLARHLSTL